MANRNRQTLGRVGVGVSLWFVVPAHGRLALSAICLRQLRRTCDALTDEGLEASAVVIACDENLSTARELGFGTIERDNRFLSRRFNDGIQLACDPAYNPRPADFVVPCGSDDWVDHRILLDLPAPGSVRAFRRLSFVREDGREMTSRRLNYAGGCGIRVYPRDVVARLGYRPADEDRNRGCDTSILRNLTNAGPLLRVLYGAIQARQIVDWKSAGEQLNGYGELQSHRELGRYDPFDELADVFPAEALDEMAAHYSRVRERVPA
jgi:hypothetical protein